MTIRLLVASTNAGKLRDFNIAAIAVDEDVTIEPLPGLKEIAAPAEDEESFEGNAEIKAIYYSRFAPGEIVVADDSGLEVDALSGAPGVRSARYADDLGYLTDEDIPVDTRNNECLMAALQDVPASRRQARYRCALIAARDGEILAVGTGSVEGVILHAPRGSGGFGYDPYFAPEGSDASMAELSPEVRLGLSHRGRALQDLLEKLSKRDLISTT